MDITGSLRIAPIASSTSYSPEFPFFISSGTSDPYCKIFFEEHNYKTKTIDCTLNPVWNEEFIFNIRSTTSKFQIEMWDKDLASSDDFMGYFELNLADIVNQGGFVEQWYELEAHPSKQEKEKAKKKKKNRGKIHLSMRLFQYHGMTKCLFENNLAAALAVVHSVPKDQTADAIAHVFYAAGTKNIVDLVSYCVLEEVNKTGSYQKISRPQFFSRPHSASSQQFKPRLCFAAIVWRQNL